MIVQNKKLFYDLPKRKQMYYTGYARLINWGRKYPTRFIEDVFGVDLLDYQKYMITRTWVADNSVWVICRNGSKTTCLALYILARTTLFPSSDVWLISRTGSQSKGLYSKMEDLANKKIPSFARITDVIKDETININHDEQSFLWNFYNDSQIHTLNGIPENARGKRSTLNVYDESGYIPEEMYAATEPFLLQDTSFKTGVDVETIADPPGNQRIFASSASSVESYFYSQYRDYFLRMLWGDKRYFAVNIDAD